MISVFPREPITYQASKHGRTVTKRNKGLSMGVLTQGPSGYSFCWVNYRHRIGSCPKRIPHGKHLTESEVDSLIETLRGGSLATRDESVEENLIIQNRGIKESEWLVIHEHCMQENNQIYKGVGNQILCVSVINGSGEETKKKMFLPLLLDTNRIS